MQQLNFKNDDDRRRFLYERNEEEGWYVWKEDHDLNRKWLRVDLDEFSVIVEEREFTTYRGDISMAISWYIYNLLRQKAQSGCKLVGYVDGYAYSVAADIIMACDEIHMGLGTSMLLHYPWMRAAGNAKQLRDFADQLDALGDASVQLYMSRAKNITEEELRSMMDKETVFSPDKCLEYGFCDFVDTYEAEKKDDKPGEGEDPEDPDTDVEELRGQLRRQLIVQQEATKMLQSLRQVKPTAPTTNISNTLIAAMKRMSVK